jgi:hypothetical protein
MNEAKAPKIPEVPATVRELSPAFLGHINYAPNANYYNCLALEFTDVGAMNEHFKIHQDQIAVSILPFGNSIFALVAKSVSDAEIEELNELTDIINTEREKRRAAREEAAELAAIEREKQEKELVELQQAGRKCREHHAPLIEEVRKLKDEVKKLKKGKS